MNSQLLYNIQQSDTIRKQAEQIEKLKAALKEMVINAEYRYPHFEDEATEAHAALVNARTILNMGEPPK